MPLKYRTLLMNSLTFVAGPLAVCGCGLRGAGRTCAPPVISLPFSRLSSSLNSPHEMFSLGRSKGVFLTRTKTRVLCTHTVPPPIPLIGYNREMEADHELVHFVNTVSEKLETKTNKGHKLVIHICIYIKLLEFNY